MSLMRMTSPHAHNTQSTGDVMRLVILATIPGVLALTLAFGWGTLVNILLASIFGLGLEALALMFRKRPIKFYLNDYTALVEVDVKSAFNVFQGAQNSEKCNTK